jgi:hypothetical protein
MNQTTLDPAKETLDILYELSTLLDCRVDKETLSILVRFVQV